MTWDRRHRIPRVSRGPCSRAQNAGPLCPPGSGPELGGKDAFTPYMFCNLNASLTIPHLLYLVVVQWTFVEMKNERNRHISFPIQNGKKVMWWKISCSLFKKEKSIDLGSLLPDCHIISPSFLSSSVLLTHNALCLLSTCLVLSRKSKNPALVHIASPQPATCHPHLEH